VQHHLNTSSGYTPARPLLAQQTMHNHARMMIAYCVARSWPLQTVFSSL